MGWNSWNNYGCNVNETVILNVANAIVSTGLKDVGYHYVNIDDCCSVQQPHNTTNQLIPDPVKFPNGIKGVADTVPASSPKYFNFSPPGPTTCAGYPASYGYE